MNSQVEIWKALPGVTGVEVSTFGRVRSVNGHYYTSFPVTGGYLQVALRVNGKWVNKLVHRLVAQTFIPNPDGSPQVNHLDCDRANNKVSNLEFCTASYNAKYREKYGESRGVPVLAINLTTLEVSRFKSQAEAGRELGVFASNINKVIKGRYKQTGGFWFTEADESSDDVIKQKLHGIGKTGLKI